MQEFVLRSGYKNLLTLPAFGLVDFYAETAAGEPMYFIGTTESDVRLGEGHLKDLAAVTGQVIRLGLGDDGVRQLGTLSLG